MQRLIRICGYVLITLALTSAFFRADGWAHAQANARPPRLDSSDAPVGSLDVSLSASVGLDSNGRWYAILENSQLKVKYAYFFENTAQTAIVALIIKAGGLNEDQAGSYLDAAAGRGLMTKATVTYNGLDRKTVRLEWDNGAKIQDVSIFPDSTYIKIDYLKFGIGLVDMGSPGGGSTGSYEFYGAGSWIRGYVTHPANYYNRYPGDGINDPVDGGSLNYNGYFVGGVYRASNNRGFGRVMPVAATDIVKLLLNRGFQFFPYLQHAHKPYTAYLYVITGGANELMAVGQQLADQLAQPTYTLTTHVSGNGTVTKTPDKASYLPGEVVTLTATADTSWLFTGWSGDLAGPANPAQVTMNSNKVITATFTFIPVTGGSALYLPLVMRGQP